MALYAKEVATPDRVVAAVQRFSQHAASAPLPADHEQALLLWVNEANAALRERIHQETKNQVTCCTSYLCGLIVNCELVKGVLSRCLS